ncbi:MAG TPA: neutral/alkaline non-lysosomal ceramidase N-terminal domain-containing protein [Gammaproteobacteria bacterium]|nr:neutral/alkaline non-lysosomal ceramidase N-terminal domain-containing protein [Gammaproteobacteria bacterium]
MKASFFMSLVVLAVGMPAATSAQGIGLRVGAAKVDLTPAVDELPQNYVGVLDRIHSRAIVIDDGATSAVLISVDAGAVPDDIWQAVTEALDRELGVPIENVLITATHTHSVPRQPADDYVDRIVESVRLARQRLVPARVGFGTGVSYINVNRNIIDPETRRWWEGPNYDGPSDKTVAVIEFETLGGEPIAVYYNYAMHAVAAGQLDMVSGDAPGTTSKYIEDSFDDAIVALWSSGAAGDQNPVYYQQTYDLREIRIRDYAERGIDISNSMPPGGQGLDRTDPAVIRLMNQQKQMILSMGQFLGEEVMHVMRGMQRMESDVEIDGRHRIVSCPGRNRLDSGRAGSPGEYEEAGPVDIRLGLLRIGDIMIGAVNAEVFNLIAQRLKDESPYAATMMATLTNGSARSGYIPNDAAYGMYTFEVLSSRVQPGCAESAIVDGVLDLMSESIRSN